MTIHEAKFELTCNAIIVVMLNIHISPCYSTVQEADVHFWT